MNNSSTPDHGRGGRGTDRRNSNRRAGTPRLSTRGAPRGAGGGRGRRSQTSSNSTRPAGNTSTGEHTREPGLLNSTSVTPSNVQNTLETYDSGANSSSTISDLPVYSSELPTIIRNQTLRYQINNKNSIGLGIVLLATMFDLFNPDAPLPEDGDTNSKIVEMNYDEKCLQKQRTFIVVHKSEDIFIGLPIYTYSGRGMVGKSAAVRAVHLRIHDCRKYDHATRQKVLDGENDADKHLYAIMHGTEQEAKLLSTNAWCKFDHPLSMSLSHKRVKILGKLTDKSAKKLFVQHYQHAFRLLTPPPSVSTEVAPHDAVTSTDQAMQTDETAQQAATSPKNESSTTQDLTDLQGTTQKSPRRVLPMSTRPTARKTGAVSQEAPRTPKMSLAEMARTSPGKRSAEGDDDDQSSGRSSKRQLRSSGSENLMQLSDDNIYPRSIPQSRGGSRSDTAWNHERGESTGINDLLTLTENARINDTQIEIPRVQRAQTGAPTEENAKEVDSNDPTEREIEILVRIYQIKREKTIQKDFAIKVLEYKDKKILKRIRELKARGHDDAQIEASIAENLNFDRTRNAGTSSAVTRLRSGIGSTLRPFDQTSTDPSLPTEHEFGLMMRATDRPESLTMFWLQANDNFCLNRIRDMKHVGESDEAIVWVLRKYIERTS